jgi:hypothetical protein
MPASVKTATESQAPGAAPGAWDRIGLALSGLCAVHCLVMPVLLLLLPLWHRAHAFHEALHPLMAVLLVPITLRALRGGAAGGRLLRCGLALVWAALPAHAFVAEGLGFLLTLAGSALLMAGHRSNLTCCRERESRWHTHGA